MNPSRELPCYMMLHEQFEHQNVANSIGNEMFELKNAASTLESAASSSKMLLIPPKCCKFYGKWEAPTPKYCKDSWNGSFQLENAANSKENGQKSRSNKKNKAEKQNPKTIPDPIYGLVFRVPTPPMVLGLQVAPPSLLFASYWRHFWGPASYLLGLCSISDYQPRIY